MQNGIPVGLRSSPSFGLSRSGQLTAIIQSLFWDGSQGWWYDDNDTTTLFQDSAGTTPVTAVEQSVGLQLDKSKGLVLGPELVTNGDFSSATGWTLINATISGGQLNCASAGAVTLASRAVSFVAGRFYKVVLTVSSYTSGTGTIVFGVGTNVTVVNFSSAGVITAYAFAATGNSELRINCTGAGLTASIDNISVRELPGNHRYAPASGNRPIFSKRVNLLTKTEQFDDAAWTKTGLNAFGSGSVANTTATTDPLGGNTADLITQDTSTGVHRVSVNPSLSGGVFSGSVYAKAAGSNRVALLLENAGGNYRAFFDITPGTSGTVVAQPSLGGGTATIESVGNNWFKISVNSQTLLAPRFFVELCEAGTTNVSFVGNGTSGIYIWGADLRPANQATGTMPLYQRVNTSTDYETNGFPGYFKADGVDDFLQTNSIDFTATDKITLCAGVRKLSDATVQILYELSANVNSNNGTFNAVPGYSGVGSGVGAYWSVGAKGTVLAAATTTATFAAPQTAVQTQVADISGDSLLLRINGAQVASSSSDQGTGNFGNYPVYFFRRGGTTLTFTGYEYGNIAVGKLLTADQLSALETYMNGLTKAY